MLCLCPLKPKGGGHIIFGVDPVCIRGASFLCIIFLRFMDFDQTCIDTLLVGGEEHIKFW